MFRHEIYQSEPGQSRKDWTFSGLVSHSLSLEQANKSIVGMEAALEELKNNMASIQQETEARK
jgi:RNA polymerase II elongation factor ELL